ncbi:MAG: hypothetical protein AAGE52_07100 [Myxococcota bacterium]
MLRIFLVLAVLNVTLDTQAQDTAAPSLEVSSDDLGKPWWAYGASADAVGAAFGDYQLRLDLGLSRHHGIALSPGWRRDGDHGPMLGVAYSVWPMGRGLHGLALSVTGDVAWIRGADRVDLALGGEVGYQYVWDGLLLGVAVGAERTWRFEGQRARSIAPIVRVQLGWAWG